MDCSLPGSSAHRIFQAGILEQVAIPFSRGSSRPREGKSLASPALAGRCFPTGAIWEVPVLGYFSQFFSDLGDVAQLCPTLCDPMDCTCQAPTSMGFSRQDYWSGLPLPSPVTLETLGSTG